MREVEVAKAVIGHVEPQGWEIYQEVQVGSGVCDIVAVKGDVVWLIETKVSLSFDVFYQSHRHKHLADYSSIAAPRRKHTGGFQMAEMFMRHLGLGFLQVTPPCYALDVYRVSERIEPALISDPHCGYPDKSWMEHLDEEHKYYCEAGSRGKERWTPWKKMCMELRQIIREADHPLTLKEVVRENLTYLQRMVSRSQLYGWLGPNRTSIPGVQVKKEGHTLRLSLYPNWQVEPEIGSDKND